MAATKLRLTTEKNNLETLDAEQEALFVASQNKTAELEAAIGPSYIDASGMVDAIAGDRHLLSEHLIHVRQLLPLEA